MQWQETVWVITDATDGSDPGQAALEALSQAKVLARGWGGEVRVFLFAVDSVDPIQLAAWQDRVAAVSAVIWPDLNDPDVRLRVCAVESLMQESRPRAIVIADCKDSAAWAARLGARLGLPLLSQCIEAKVTSKGLRARRAVHGDAVHWWEEYSLDQTSTALILPELGAWPSAASQKPRAEGVQVIELPTGTAGYPVRQVKRIRRILPQPGDLELVDADLVLSGGAGLGSAEGFAVLRTTARALGAAVGASRVAVDRGWAEAHEQVGLTGRRVRPRIYAAFGISGALEHLVGINEAKTVVAVNTDRQAPIATISKVFAVSEALVVLKALAIEADRRLKTADG